MQKENNPELLSIPYVIKFYRMVLTTTAWIGVGKSGSVIHIAQSCGTEIPGVWLSRWLIWFSDASYFLYNYISFSFFLCLYRSVYQFTCTEWKAPDNWVSKETPEL